MKKKIFLVLACVFLLAGCNGVKLTNGENAVVTFNEGGVSSEELYKSLKEAYGAEKLMNLIDTKLLSEKYKTDASEKAYVNQTVKTTKESAKKLNADFDLYLQYYYGLSSESKFRDYISLTYKRNLWVQDYAEEEVTEKQIQQYYDEEVVGDIEASHILITVDSKKNATEEEKKKAEQKAYDKAKEVIEKLKKGEDFSKLAKEYSKDSTTADKGGSLGKINTGDYADEVFEALKNLKDGSYSTSPVKSSYGYHIVYRTSQDKKAKLDDDLTKKIRTTIGKEKANESGYSVKALKALREKNNMKFEDAELEKAFNKLIQQQEKQAASSTSSSNQNK